MTAVASPATWSLVGDIGAEALGSTAIVPDGAADGGYLLVAGRPLTATAKPSRARRRAITAPRPRELPVTKATRPCVTAT